MQELPRDGSEPSLMRDMEPTEQDIDRRRKFRDVIDRAHRLQGEHFPAMAGSEVRESRTRTW